MPRRCAGIPLLTAWDAAVQQSVSLSCLGGGLIPKASVAFAGTYVVGLGLEKLNSMGTGLSARERRDAYADAFAKGRDVVRDMIPDRAESSEKGNPKAGD